jgi:threonine efflux protein
MEIAKVFANIGAAVGVYLVATMSPGPGNLAIMNASMQFGRGAGLSVATGVVTGSLFWGLLAAAGLAILIAAHPGTTAVVMILGGLYLGYLASKSFRSFSRALSGAASAPKRYAGSARGLYMQGLAIHLLNPKSALAWSAIIAIVLVPGSPPMLPLLVVAGCWLLGVMVFYGYALLFSSRAVISWYGSHGFWVDLASGALFTYFAFRLIERGLGMSGLVTF